MRKVGPLCLALLGCKPAPQSASSEAAPSATTPGVMVDAAPVASERRVGEIFFIDAGVQATLCERESPPLPLFKEESHLACWYAGTSCEGHGSQQGEPFTLAGTLLSGQTIHGGCDLGNYALVYERGTSPLRLRVCVKRPPPMDCPASVKDGARWDISALLEANHATRAVLLKP